MDTGNLAPISQGEYIQAEAAYLARRLAEGDTEAATVSAMTLRAEVSRLLRILDPEEETVGRITTSQGLYYRWPVLDR